MKPTDTFDAAAHIGRPARVVAVPDAPSAARSILRVGDVVIVDWLNGQRRATVRKGGFRVVVERRHVAFDDLEGL